MRNIAERVGRKWHASPATFALRATASDLMNSAGGSPATLRILLASDGAVYTSEQQFAPLLRNAAALRRSLGIVMQQVNFDDAMRMPPDRLVRFDLIGVKLSFRTQAGQAVEQIEALRNRLAGASTRLVYFDGDDDLNIQWPELLDLVDLYVKKHVFADYDDYARSYIGKSNLTDWTAATFGVDFSGDIIPASGGIDAARLARLHTGWNIALDDKIADLAAALAKAPAPGRTIDITCRAHVSPESWIHPMRNLAAGRLGTLAQRFTVAAPRERVPQSVYYAEMRRSKICVSPFGYGEICWRDFEAILCGCLLVKPDMSHVKTAPDLFVPGQTYIPFSWDYSDLEEVCGVYLKNDDERRRITRQAREILCAALRPDWLVGRVGELLPTAGFGEPRPGSRS